jgi:hypothetical protein
LERYVHLLDGSLGEPLELELGVGGVVSGSCPGPRNPPNPDEVEVADSLE